MQTAALYIRVSTEDQTEFSPDAQKRLLLEYANKNNMIIDNDYIFIDEGISGRKAEKRPAFMKMIATAKKKPKPFDVILVHKFDRFSRSREDSIVYKSLLKKECDIKVLSITEQLEDDKFSVILEAMLEAMAEYYSLNLSEEVTKGMTEKALRGGYQAGSPLGYELVAGESVPRINNAQADIIKIIFDKYVNDNMDLTAIARYLNDCGYKTKRNNYFEQRTVRYILKNPFYIGKVRWNRAKHSSHIENPEEEIIIADGVHEPIIDNDIFNLAQERLNKETRPYKARDISSCKHWLSGLIKCSICGKSLVFQQPKGRVQNFQCYAYAKGIHKGSHYITAQNAISFITKSLEKVIITNEIDFEVKQFSIDSTLKLKKLEKELDRISVKEKRIKIAYMDGIDSLEEYKANKELLLEAKTSIKDQIKDLKRPKKVTKDEMLNKVKSVYNIITDENCDYGQKGNAIRSIVDNIVYLKENKAFEVTYYL